MYISAYFSGYVFVIDRSNDEISAKVKVGNHPTDVKYNPSNNNMYVVNSGSDGNSAEVHEIDDVSVINSSSNEVVTTIQGFNFVPNFPGAIEYNPQTTNLYTADSQSVSIIDSNRSLA